MSIFNLFRSNTSSQLTKPSSNDDTSNIMKPACPSKSTIPQAGTRASKTASANKSATETDQQSTSTSAAPVYCASCSMQLSRPGSSLSVSHTSSDLHVPARRPKTPPRLTELRADDIKDEFSPGASASPRARQFHTAHPNSSLRNTEADPLQPSPNNTPMSGPGMDTFGSMNKPSPNNTPMCDRYTQDSGMKYPDNIPDAPTTPLRMKATCEVKYGAANLNFDRDNGMSGSIVNHLKLGKGQGSGPPS